MRVKIQDSRLKGKEPDKYNNNNVLKHLSELIIHDSIHGNNKTIGDQKTLYNIFLTVVLLSKKTAKQENESKVIREKYTLKEHSIWDDIGFMLKFFWLTSIQHYK